MYSLHSVNTCRARCCSRSFLELESESGAEEDAEADANAMLDAGLHGYLQPSLRADKATE